MHERDALNLPVFGLNSVRGVRTGGEVHALASPSLGFPLGASSVLMSTSDAVRVESRGSIRTIIINRPKRRNAIDPKTAALLAEAFRAFDEDDSAAVAVLHGAGGHFSAGADLKSLAAGDLHNVDPDPSTDGPLGCTRMSLSKPVIASIEGYAVAGGLELACWCDLRIVAEDAKLGVFCRRVGVPLVDGGTQRLPRIVGLGRALDLILTGREISAQEAYAMGLATRVVATGSARDDAESLALMLAAMPQRCMRSDRQAVYEGLGLGEMAGLAREADLGLSVLDSGEPIQGAKRFVRSRTPADERPATEKAEETSHGANDSSVESPTEERSSVAEEAPPDTGEAEQGE